MLKGSALPMNLSKLSNQPLTMDGLTLLGLLPPEAGKAAFFDPQYRGILDKMRYGNEGVNRGRNRSELTQMSEETIRAFLMALDRVLVPSGHVFLWVDKFHLCSGVTPWLDGTALEIVDLIVWAKPRIGMGYRTRRKSEYLVVLQKIPKRAKGVWHVHDIPDVVADQAASKGTHAKPIELQKRLIEAVTHPGDVVLDPAAGTFSVLDACQACDRTFIGCDINPRLASPGGNR